MGDYSSGDEASLPTDSTNLDHVYDATDLSNVGTNDTNYVNQTGSAGYELHQYKDSITAGNATVTWIGKSSLAPSSSKVQLQVYKVAAPAGWQDVSGAGASNNVAAADTDFTLSGTLATADYLDTGVTTFRIYQAASESIIDSYTDTGSIATDEGMYGDGTGEPANALGMTWTSNGYNVTSIQLYLKKLLAPTGNITVYVYSHTGTWGSTGIPNALLGTSQTVSIAGLGTSYAWVPFTFSTPVSTVNTTHYVWYVQFSGGDVNNQLQIAAYDDQGTAGNECYYNYSEWHATIYRTLLFKVMGVPA